MARGFLAVFSTLLLSMGALAEDTWPYMTLQTADFTPPQLEVKKTGTTDPGYIFIGPRGNQPNGTAALIYDEDGNLVYQGPTEVSANFKVQNLYNKDVITFWAGNMMELGFGYGTVHILDDTYEEIYTVTLPGNFISPDGVVRDSYIDLHESHVTSRNTLLVTAYNITQFDLTPIGGKTDDYMLDGMFFEIDIATNNIVYQWSALEHIQDLPLEQSKQGLGDDYGTQEKPWDAYHINSVELVDGGWIISLRHYWSGYFIAENGTIMWQLSGEKGVGDFEIDDGAVFSWQHDMRVYNQTNEGMVLDLFNNANTPTETVAPTTGLSLSLDLVNRKVTTLRTMNDGDDVIHSVSQGSYQLMSEETSHVFIGYGSISKVKEFDANNNAVLTAQFGDDNAVASYRGYKCQWKATPFWKPAVVVERHSTSATVHMSWNGATEYDNWAIYTASSPESTDHTFITSAKRTGFETAVDVNNLRSPYFQVVARKGNVPLSSIIVPVA
ncbi:ASST-domain-containing protein [Aspergillus caelatus]|uniref:ASST-domain-containing protein n=2 Tax=Aspergillus subgen. Circumdati TaxID=2720871 RepID=A0A5N7ADC0_9EURO|nr:ASST-domain-containing protein [Aspergillus caelatus]KAE8367864.1 ASST-domain-containing protein [Aspergillus caelatus]KAE8421733.1 ASST-domain-containing protein [Aspergillus pseudocaelatus]